MKRRNDLDDMVRKGDVTFAYTVFNTFLKRIDERVALIDDLLETEFDFTADEVIETDRDAAEYPKTQDDA